MLKTNLSAIVTGASRGIGKAIALHLAQQNYRVLLIARNADELKNAQEEIIHVTKRTTHTHLVSAIDIANLELVEKAVNTFLQEVGTIDILVNNAGYVKRGTSDLAPKEFHQMIDTNLIGAFNLIHSTVPYMKAQKFGRIFNISSYSGVVARKYLGGYAASKAGLNALNESLYKELAEYNIYTTAICPSLVATDMTSDVQMDIDAMLSKDDVIKTVKYLLSLSPSVMVKEVHMQCKKKVIENESY